MELKRRPSRCFFFSPKFISSLASLLIYLNSLDSQFVYDDTRAILQNTDLHPSTPLTNLLVNDFWGTPMTHNGSHKSYRPLCTFSFRLNYLFSGYNPYGYHLVNVICHVAVTFMVTLLAEKLRMSKLAVLLTGLLFALHPIHTEAVCGIVGRADLLSAFFYLLAITTYLEHLHYRDKSMDTSDKLCDKNGNYEKVKKTPKLENNSTDLKNFYLCATLCSASCSMFSKEQGITCLGICLVYDLIKLSRNRTQIVYQLKKGSCQNLKKILSSMTVLVGGLAVLLYIRARAMGFTSPTFAKSDNPASGSSSFLVRLMTFTYLPVLNFVLMMTPTTLSFDWSMDSVPLVQSVWDPRNAASVLFFSALGIFSYKIVTNLWKHFQSKLPALSLAMIVLPFLPATNLFFYVGFVVAERVLYIPSIGYCLMLGFSIAKLIEYGRGYKSTISSALVLLLLVIFGLKTVSRNKDWKNEENLYRSGMVVNPPKALGNLGNVWTQQRNYKEAEWAFRKALTFKNNMADVHYNLGVLLQQQKRTQESISSYKEAIKYRPNMALAHMNLGIAMQEIGLQSEALSILLGVEKLQDDGTKDPKSHFITQVGSLFNAGKFCLESGRAQQAINILLRAKSMGQRIKYNNQQGILNLLGEAYMAANNSAEAELWYRAALKEKPDHVPAYLTYGKLLAKNKTRIFEAENFFLRAKAISPDDFNVHLHYGLYLMDLERFAEAASNFEKAANLKTMDYEANFNAGVAYRQAGDFPKAESFYRRAVKIMPQDPSSHMNLGAMLHLAGKLLEAESEYMISLKLRPGDVSTRTNIQRLHNIMKKKGLKTKELDPL